MSDQDDKRHKKLLHYALERMDMRINRLQRARERLARLIENTVGEEDKQDDTRI